MRIVFLASKVLPTIIGVFVLVVTGLAMEQSRTRPLAKYPGPKLTPSSFQFGGEATRPSPVQKPIFEWKSYGSKEDGYRLAYDPSWEVQEGYHSVSFMPPGVEVSRYFTVTVATENMRDLEEFLKKQAVSLVDFKNRYVKGRRDKTGVFIPRGDKVYTIFIDGIGDVTSNIERQFEDLISTFRFLD